MDLISLDTSVCVSLMTVRNPSVKASVRCHHQLLTEWKSATQVLVAKQEVDELRETIQRLRQHRNPSPSQSSIAQPPVDSLNIADALHPTLAQQRSQAIASPSTPSYTPWVNTSIRSIGSSLTDASVGRGLSSVSGLHALVFESDRNDDQVEGGIEGALDPLLLEAENVVTNPMFCMEGHGTSVPATPTTTAPRLLQAVALQQVQTALTTTLFLTSFVFNLVVIWCYVNPFWVVSCQNMVVGFVQSYLFVCMCCGQQILLTIMSQLQSALLM